jgi:uncharacterized protein (TIGR02246 family)
MKRNWFYGLAIVAAAIALIAMGINAQTPAPPPVATLAVKLQAPAAAPAEEADRAAITKAAADFAEAFNKGDAKAIAAMWTENGESRSVDGPTLVGRAAIEKSFTELFKRGSGAKIEVLVKSIRFPAKNMAVEQGLLRLTVGAKGLPSTTSYVAVHSREAGGWKIALSSEAGYGQQRLEDLDWLLGSWTTKVKDNDVTFAFVKDPKKAVITGTFTRTPSGKEAISGSIRIAYDPELGQIRSWGFEDDGAHSQSLWFNDGKSWLLELRGVLADGTPVSEVLILQRVAADAITWRSTDRFLGDDRLPDTKPMRLTRVK